MTADFIKIMNSMDRYITLCSPEVKKSASIKRFMEKLNYELTKEDDEDKAIDINEAIDKVIRSNKGDKEKLVKFIAGFCEFMERTEKMKLELKVLSAEVIDDPTERRLRIACFLHEPRTTEDIAEHFFQDERTIRNDLAALRDGIDFFGQQIQIQADRKDKKVHYISTLHPVFLPLNLTEVYALTAGLLQVVPQDNPLYDIYRYLAEFVYNQLSEYGKQIIHNSAAQYDVNLPPVNSNRQGAYRDERKLIERREGSLAYMLKRFEECDIEYAEAGENKEIRGRIKFNVDIDNKAINVITKEGTLTINLSDIVVVKPVKYI